MTQLTVFYDGACPLCVREISLMKRLDREERLSFENVADPDAEISCPIRRQDLLDRFHARLPSGEVVSGARAFGEAYARIPWLGWVGPLVRFAPSRAFLDVLYLGFLRIRPLFQKLAARFAPLEDGQRP